MEGVLASQAIADLALAKLTEHGRLSLRAARLRCTPIQRGGELCGLHFALRGPRDVLLTAVWDASTGALWCYDSRGERFLRVETAGDRQSLQKSV